MKGNFFKIYLAYCDNNM